MKNGNCPKSRVNLLNIVGTGMEEPLLALTKMKKATYPDPRTEKQRTLEAKAQVEKEMMAQ